MNDHPINLYCERLNTSFWAEPVNALSNIAFIITGIAALILIRRNKETKNWQLITLAILAFIVGIGSFIFHTFATVLTSWGDNIPIIIFVSFLLYLVFIRAFNVRPFISILYLIAYSIANVLFLKLFGDKLFHGSIAYVPILLIFLFIGLVTRHQKPTLSNNLLLSAVIFFISIIFRSIDGLVCPQFPIGTHFIWHILNAVSMYFQMRAVIITRTAVPAKAKV